MSLYRDIEDVLNEYIEGDAYDPYIQRLIHEVVEPREKRMYNNGYKTGEMERIALATANTELRSELLRLKQALDSIDEAINASYKARSAGPSLNQNIVHAVGEILDGLGYCE